MLPPGSGPRTLPSSRRALVRRAGSDPSRGELKPDNKRIDISLGPALAWGKRCLPAATLLGGDGANGTPATATGGTLEHTKLVTGQNAPNE